MDYYYILQEDILNMYEQYFIKLLGNPPAPDECF